MQQSSLYLPSSADADIFQTSSSHKTHNIYELEF